LYGRVGFIRYYRQAAALDESLINFFKAENCPDTQWHVVTKGSTGYWSGQVDGKEAYQAWLSDDHKILEIVTTEYLRRVTTREFWEGLTR
jgi:hypothetical protein